MKAKVYHCMVCGYGYKPGTYDAMTETINKPWTHVPKAWKCPECGAEKRRFVESKEFDKQHKETGLIKGREKEV